MTPFWLAAIAVAMAFVAPASTGVWQSPSQWRELALSSFDEAWKTVNDTFYDPAFGGTDWAAVRTELRPRVAAAPTPDSARAAIQEMLGRLHQSHFTLLSSAIESETLPGDALVPIDIRVLPAGAVVSRVMAGSTAAVAGVRPGDRLIAIDGRDVPAPSSTASAADARAASVTLWRSVFRDLHGNTGSVARLTLLSPSGDRRTLAVTRVREPGESVTLGNLPPLQVETTAAEMRTPRRKRVGVIRFNVWMTAVAAPFAAAIDRFRGADGLVIDLRGNPGGLADMIRGLAGHLVADPVLLGRMHMRNLDLEFRANPRRSTMDGRQVEPYAGPVAVLVDELTASASECFTGGLQSVGRVTVFGARTMGQALPASTKRLSNGDVLLYAIGDFVTSTGYRLEGPGVVPDVLVPLTIPGLASGRDEPLDAALRWIDSARPPAR